MPRKVDLFGAEPDQFFLDDGPGHPTLAQQLSAKALFLAQKTQKQVLGANVLISHTLSFFCCVPQHTLALVAQR